ncbi:hypothetical protein D3C81_1912230 [compost metagenome]
MVGDDKATALAAQSLEVVNAVIQHARQAHDVHEETKAGGDTAACQPTAFDAIALNNQQEIKPDQRQKQSAHAKQREAKSGHDQTP